MLNLEHLKHLITFADEGTLSRSAEILNISQSTLTRSMQNIEEQLAVSIFIRGKNKLQLNSTGEYAVKEAKKLLANHDNFITNVRYFSLHKNIILGGVSSFGILWEFEYRKKSVNVNIKLDRNFFYRNLAGTTTFSLSFFETSSLRST